MTLSSRARGDRVVSEIGRLVVTTFFFKTALSGEQLT
jgi:hypothetical protein